MNNVIEELPLPEIYYHARESTYWRKDKTNRWIKVNDTSAKNFIAEQGYSKTATETGANSEVDRCLMDIQTEQNVAYVGPLAGYSAGVYSMGDNKILVTDSPKFITPKAGSWDTLARLFEGMFVEGEVDQRPYFYGWIKSAMDSFRLRRWKASQVLAMAGEAKSGKSLTQNLLTIMFGGRSAKPYQFMMGDTDFNSHMFGAEHLMLEDEAESVDIRSRRHFAANIKTILASRDQNCHGKQREALILNPIWRMSLSLNDDPERLQVLPPLDSDIRDKIIVLRVYKRPMPMPTGTTVLDELFWSQMVSELPAFLDYLDKWQVPEELTDDRYGIAAYQHPEVVEKLEQTSPELRLLEIIDRGLFGGQVAMTGNTPPNPWEGTAAALEAKLVSSNSTVTFEARKLLNWQNSCGTYLGRLKESTNASVAGRVTSRKLNGHTSWTIVPPVCEPETVISAANTMNSTDRTDQPPSPPAGLCMQ
jgi:hypothetical protein